MLLIRQVVEVLKNYILDPACFRVAEQNEEPQRNSSKSSALSVFIDRFAPGGDLWHPQMFQSEL